MASDIRIRTQADTVARRVLAVFLRCTAGLSIALLAAAALAQSPDPPTGDTETPDEDLAERLIREATGDQDDGVMHAVVRLMDRSASRLHREFDPGPTTCSVQREIVKKLDEAIAAAQRNRSKSSPSVPRADRRRGTSPQPNQPDARAEPTDGERPDPTSNAPAAATQPVSPAERFRESRRGWGHLPPRDRDEILQAIDEDVLEKYRKLADDYFRALAEDEEE